MNTDKSSQDRFNYGYVIRLIQAHMCGSLSRHVNLLNASLGCRGFSKDSSRFIPLYIYDEDSKKKPSKYSSYLTGMLKEERSVITEIKEIFEKGYSDKFEKPSAELFEEIVKEHGHFKYDDSEIKIRIQIIEVLERELENLEKGESSHIKKEEINNLLGLAKDSTVTIWAFIYNCIYTAAMCGGNTRNRKSTGSRSKELENSIFNDVAGFSEAEKAKSVHDIHKRRNG